MEIRTIGIDLGKTVFHLVGVNVRGEVVVRKKCSRLQLLRFTSNLRECLIGIEACGGSHFLGRALREQGHDVRMLEKSNRLGFGVNALQFFRSGRFDLGTKVTDRASGLLALDGCENALQQRVLLHAAEKLPPFGPIDSDRHHLRGARIKG